MREDFFEGGRQHLDGQEKDDAKEKKIKEREALLQKAREGWMDFFRTFEKVIQGYFGTPDIPFTVKPGGWYVDLEKIRVNADPTFFLEKGYSESESMFATFHEAEHFRDMIEDPGAYQRLFTRFKSRTDVHASYPKVLQRLYNCLDDILVNRVVMNRWKAGSKAVKSLYPKLFPTNDFRGQPRHRQFMYAFLREAMLPEEPALLDPEVREVLEMWQKRGGNVKAIDVLTGVDPSGKARFSAQDRYARYQATLEPLFEEMYRWDLDHKKKNEGKGKEEGEGEGDGDPFEDDPFADAIPDPVDFDKAAEQAKRLHDRHRQKKKDAFKEVMGVEKADFDSYQQDAKVVEPYVERMSAVFDKVIMRRKTYRRVLKKSTKEGVILNPPKAAIGVAEIKAGHDEPEIMLDYQKREIIQNRPNRLEFTLVCDGSGSMARENKDLTQRRLAVLAMEGFAKFRDRIEKERRAGEKIDLSIRSEARMFANEDDILKPLSESLTHVERVKMHKKLKKLPEEDNKEWKTFDAIESEQFTDQTIKDLRKGDLKKVIVFLSDGQTDEATIQAKIKNLMELAGTGPDGKSNLVIACIGFGDGIQALTTYAPNGYFAKTLEEVPEIFEKLI